MIKFLEKLTELISKRSKTPWARFTVGGIQSDGQIKFEMSWNEAFIDDVCQHGFAGATEQETVENFLLGALMFPKSLDDDIITSEAHPDLQPKVESHRIQRG